MCVCVCGLVSLWGMCDVLTSPNVCVCVCGHYHTLSPGICSFTRLPVKGGALTFDPGRDHVYFQEPLHIPCSVSMVTGAELSDWLRAGSADHRQT